MSQIESVPGDLQLIEAVTAHCEKELGPCELVLDEIESPVIHLDLFRFTPDQEDPFRVFVTCGMSSKPMNVLPQVVEPERYRFAEMAVCLPGDWPMEWDELKKPENWWPLAALRSLARLPHEQNTWVWGGHTLANGQPYAPDTELCAALVCANDLFDETFDVMEFGGHDVVFLLLAFLYQNEYDFVRQHSSAAFMRKVIESGLTPYELFVLDKKRRNVLA